MSLFCPGGTRLPIGVDVQTNDQIIVDEDDNLMQL